MTTMMMMIAWDRWLAIHTMQYLDFDRHRVPKPQWLYKFSWWQQWWCWPWWPWWWRPWWIDNDHDGDDYDGDDGGQTGVARLRINNQPSANSFGNLIGIIKWRQWRWCWWWWWWWLIYRILRIVILTPLRNSIQPEEGKVWFENHNELTRVR